MRAARYARVSTSKQADNTSIPNQLERCAAYIEAQGWELVATFIEPGESGENLDRPAMTAARQAARQGEFDVLVIYTLDRLTRDIDDLFLLRRELKREGARGWAVRDGLDVTAADPDDLLKILFHGYFGHRERQETLRRTTEGVRRHVRDGKYPGGMVPYGYERDKDNYLVIQEETAAVVRMIFQWAAEEGMSGRAIARRLNAMEIPSAKARLGKRTVRQDGVRQVPKWIPATVRNILRGEVYVGQWTYKSSVGDMSIEVPSIVDKATWEKAQETAKKNRRNCRPAEHPYLLRGLIKCECGASYCGRPPRRGGNHSYRCIARYDWVHRRMEKCSSLTVPGLELEAAVWSDIEEFVRQPHLVVAELRRRRGPASVELTTRLAEVDQAIAERKAEIDRYLKLYGRGKFPIEQLDAKVDEVRGHLVGLEAYRDQLVDEQRRSDLWEREMVSVVEALVALQEKLDAGLTFDDKVTLVKMLVKGIMIETCTDDAGEEYAKAHVVYRFERPDVSEMAIPIELEPLFTNVGMATYWLNLGTGI